MPHIIAHHKLLLISPGFYNFVRVVGLSSKTYSDKISLVLVHLVQMFVKNCC